MFSTRSQWFYLTDNVSLFILQPQRSPYQSIYFSLQTVGQKTAREVKIPLQTLNASRDRLK
ncbi:hypothetical protein QUA32_23560 [Microcoleus sp. Pol14D6]|uniref:hypothetical protein n=1 Tax=unclassified Microcoleus TaxID=2642155 RepID=UPI002FCF95BC